MHSDFTSVELCAGGGGQALGLERAGFGHLALVEIDDWSRRTLRQNRPHWNVVEGPQADLTYFDPRPYSGVDLVAGGVPCPPFSVAGKQLGPNDERDLFPAALNVVDQLRPGAVMLENVRGFLDPVFADYRAQLAARLASLGYSRVEWRLLNACDFGVPQLRPRVVIVALQRPFSDAFEWPSGGVPAPTVGDCLHDLMAQDGWAGARAWSGGANAHAPTIVGGSKKHGGPDLGPTRARRAWAALGVNGLSIADQPPPSNFEGMPRLTVRMVARLQGFPDDWEFAGRKTAAYRQVGNAFPPPVAHAVATRLRIALQSRRFSAVA